VASGFDTKVKTKGRITFKKLQHGRKAEVLYNPSKEKIHKIFLIVSTCVVFHGVSLSITAGGGINLATLKFFTILSNLLLGIAFIVRILRYRKNDTQWLSFSALIAITVTCLVYNFVLVPIGGAASVLSGYDNFVTHLLAMVLAFANYLFFEGKGNFSYKHVLVSMVFPVMYWLIFVTEKFDFSPYFFMDPAQIGWGMAIIWFGLLLCVFALISVGLIKLDASDKARKIFRNIFVAGLSAATMAMVIFGLFFGGIILIFMHANRPRALEPHELYKVLENGVDMPAEGLTFEPGISLYINLRGNDIRFHAHEHDEILIMFELGRRSVYHHPVYEFTYDEYGAWLRIADETRTRRGAIGKNSSDPAGGVIVFVPANMSEVFHILDISGQYVWASNAVSLHAIAERVYQ